MKPLTLNFVEKTVTEKELDQLLETHGPVTRIEVDLFILHFMICQLGKSERHLNSLGIFVTKHIRSTDLDPLKAIIEWGTSDRIVVEYDFGEDLYMVNIGKFQNDSKDINISTTIRNVSCLDIHNLLRKYCKKNVKPPKQEAFTSYIIDIV